MNSPKSARNPKPKSSLGKKFGIGCGTAVLVIILALTATVYFLGPTWGPLVAGKPVFMGNKSPQRYGNAVVSFSEKMGIYSDSPEFAEAKARAKDAIAQAQTTEELYPVLTDVARAAGGKHSKLLLPSEEAKAPSDEQEAPRQPGVDKRGNIAFATVPEISRHDNGQAYADAIAGGLDRAVKAGACGAIVDLRGNGGGDMGPMVAGLSPLLPDGPVLEFVSNFSTTPVYVEGNAVRGGGTPVTSFGGKVNIPTAVLVDEQTASSGEATMLAFRGLDNSRSFGQPTAGYASANMVIDYPDGSALMLTTAKDKARTGEVFAEDPIQPDEVLPADKAEKAAAAWLSKRGCT